MTESIDLTDALNNETRQFAAALVRSMRSARAPVREVPAREPEPAPDDPTWVRRRPEDYFRDGRRLLDAGRSGTEARAAIRDLMNRHFERDIVEDVRELEACQRGRRPERAYLEWLSVEDRRRKQRRVLDVLLAEDERRRREARKRPRRTAATIYTLRIPRRRP